MAREAGVPLTIDDFDTVNSRTPLIANLKPGGRYVAVDVDRAGGIQLIAQRLVQAGLVDGEQITASGLSLGAKAAVGGPIAVLREGDIGFPIWASCPCKCKQPM
jgi:dihydroxy-acid dehydratase